MNKPTSVLTVILASFLSCSVMNIGSLSAAPKTTFGMSDVGRYIHIKYTTIQKRPALPKDYIAEVTKGWEEQAEAFSRQPNGQENARINRVFISKLRDRAVPQPNVTGTSEYWGTSKCMRWTTSLRLPSFTFNGKYVNMVIKESDFGGIARPNNSRPAEYLRTVLSKSLFDSYVPYLGFNQPGKALFLAQENKTHQLSVGCQKSYSTPRENCTIVVTYDKQGQPTLVEEKDSGHVMVSTAFNNYTQFGGRFLYPKTVKRTQYKYYGDRTGKHPIRVVDEITEYNATAIDSKPVGSEMFDVQHPRVGVSVHDFRPEYGDSPYGVSYHYDDTNLTIDEASSKTAELTQANRSGVISILLRFLCLAIALFVLGRVIIGLRKRSSA